MKKVIRLTESELHTIIKRVINEQTASLTQGKVSPEVVKFQENLKALGYNLGPKGADGYFGPVTQAAVKQFQIDHDLNPTGVVDDQTNKMIHAIGLTANPLRRVTNVTVSQLQQKLVDKGYPIKVDGLHGPKTTEAVKKFQQSNMIIPITGKFDQTTIKKLMTPAKTLGVLKTDANKPATPPPTQASTKMGGGGILSKKLRNIEPRQPKQPKPKKPSTGDQYDRYARLAGVK